MRKIALAPGGAKNVMRDDALRRWPIEHYAKLAILLREKGYEVVITGAETDGWCSEYFLGFENLIGKTGLLELIDFYKQCSLLITHDSGPMHLAKLSDCEVIALFGPTNPFERTGSPEKIHVIWGGKDLPCRPCYDGKNYPPCKSNICLKQITPEEVLELVELRK